MLDDTIITDRCILRRLSLDEDEQVWAISKTPGFTDGMTWDPAESIDDVHAFTQSCIDAWDTGKKCVWSVFAKDGTFIGRMEVLHAEEIPGNVWGLGYWIRPEEQGKGYATEAAAAAIRFAFERKNADAVVSSHHDWNVASGRVLTKIGMKHTGFSDGRTFKHGKPVRAAEFWLNRADWEKTNT